MAKVERSILINAPTDAIDEIALDAARLPDWYAGVEEANPDDTYPEVGGTVSLVYKSSGVTFHITLTVLELVRGDYILYELGGMMTGTQHWSHTPEGRATRTTAVINYEMPGGALGKIADKLVVERMNNKNLEESLVNLKALVEG